MRVRFFGVRGSMPAPGADFVRYGGHTACVAVYADGQDTPAVVFDAGTGLQSLATAIDGRPFDGTILLSHLQWDHVQGLPFFAPAEHGGSHTTVLVPAGPGDDPVALLRPMVGPPFFPLAPDELRGRWSFGVVPNEPFRVGPFTVTALRVAHLGLTLGYRVSDGTHSVAYLTDRQGDDATPLRANALALADRADLLIHDAQHTAAEYPAKAFLGHATAEHALALAAEAGARQVALYHHDFARTDEQIDALVAGLRSPVPFFAAAEGRVVEFA